MNVALLPNVMALKQLPDPTHDMFDMNIHDSLNLDPFDDSMSLLGDDTFISGNSTFEDPFS